MSFHLFQNGHQLNYQYTDRVVRSYINMGGALFNVYKFDKVKKNDGTTVDVSQFTLTSPVFMENGYRVYSKMAYDLYGVTQMNTPKFSFTFAGISGLDGDEKEISFHYNSMVEQLGRKIIVGDVIEWTWLRDLDVMGNETRGFNKFYVVTDSARDEKGWSANYTYHLWKIKCKPITMSSEFTDLINNGDGSRPGSGDGINGGEGIYKPNGQNAPGTGNGDVVPETGDVYGQDDIENQIMDKILELAEEQVSFREYDQHHIYIDEDTAEAFNPYVMIGDGIPNNMNAVDIPYGEYFPEKPEVGDYFLRIDYDPPRLFQREESSWKLIEFDNRPRWTGVADVLRNIINQDNSYIDDDGNYVKMRENIKDLVKARVKKEHGRPLDWKKIGVTKP